MGRALQHEIGLITYVEERERERETHIPTASLKAVRGVRISWEVQDMYCFLNTISLSEVSRSVCKSRDTTVAISTWVRGQICGK